MNPTVVRLLRTFGVALLLFLAFVTWQFLNRWNRIVRLEESVARPLEFDYYSGPAVSSAPHGGRLIGSFHNFLEWWFRDHEPKPPIHGWTVTCGRNSPNRLQAALLGEIDKIRIHYTDICGPDFGPALEAFDGLVELQLYGSYFETQKSADLNTLLESVSKLPNLRSFDFARTQEVETRDRQGLRLPDGSPPHGRGRGPGSRHRPRNHTPMIAFATPTPESDPRA